MSIGKFAWLLLALALFASKAEAMSTGWIKGSAFVTISDQIERDGYMPVSVQCVDSGAPGLGLDAAYVRIEYQRNPTGIAWQWMGSTNVTHDVRDMEAQGYHLVSKDSFIRKRTGLAVYCLIFHK